MSDPALEDQIAAATAYENLYVGALFQEWAPRVAEAAPIQPGHRVLDVACGTGILAREALARVGANGRIAGLDANPGMLAVAERISPDIEWQQGTAESLPYPDQSFDVVVSQFGLMFFPDRQAALREMLRVLVPGGRLAIAVWDAIENSPVYPSWAALLERSAGQAAADALRAPFVLGDRNELETLFENAGASEIAITTTNGTANFPSIQSLAEADLRGWLPVMDVILTETHIQRLLQEAEDLLRPHLTADGNMVFDSPAHIVTATRT